MSSHPDDMNPHDEPPALGSFGRPGSSGLGSLAQSARGKHLKQARGWLIAVGVLTLVGNIIFFFLAQTLVHEQIQKEVRNAGPRMVFDQAKLQDIEETQVRTQKLVAGATAALGIVFIVLGVLVNRFPVPATAIGLVLYIGANVIFAVLNPETINGIAIIIKVIIIAALAKSLQAAIAYQRESQTRLAVGDDFG